MRLGIVSLVQNRSLCSISEIRWVIWVVIIIRPTLLLK